MPLSRQVFLAAPLLAAAAATHAGGDSRTHYVELVNRAHASVVSLAAAPAGTGAFQEQVMDGPLHGGGDSATIGLRGTGCRYDLRFVFRDGRTLVYRGADACRARVVRIRPLPAGDASGRHFTVSLERGRR